jgi:hypothetical protein
MVLQTLDLLKQLHLFPGALLNLHHSAEFEAVELADFPQIT